MLEPVVVELADRLAQVHAPVRPAVEGFASTREPPTLLPGIDDGIENALREDVYHSSARRKGFMRFMHLLSRRHLEPRLAEEGDGGLFRLDANGFGGVQLHLWCVNGSKARW
jgi:hypothetical protein